MNHGSLFSTYSKDRRGKRSVLVNRISKGRARAALTRTISVAGSVELVYGYTTFTNFRSKWLLYYWPNAAKKRSLNSYSGLYMYSSIFRDGRPKRPTCRTTLTTFFLALDLHFQCSSSKPAAFNNCPALIRFLRFFFTATPCISLKINQVFVFLHSEKTASLQLSQAMASRACL